MKKIVVLILISVFLLGCSLPFTISWKNTPTAVVETSAPVEIQTEAPTQAPTEAPTAVVTESPFIGTEKNLGGVSMVLPPCMAANATGTLIEAVPYDENSGPAEYFPANRKITFQGYPLSGKFFSVDDPQNNGGLTVYPAPEFGAMNQYIADRITAMQTLLAAKPAAPDSIPLLPIFNAAQIFRSQVKYLNFQNGQGVRFLTEYAQSYAPVNNDELFYAFEGLTGDGKYWVSAILPVNAAYLQESYDSANVPDGGIAAPNYNDPNLDTSMQNYYADMVNRLNTTPDTEFTPGLDCLDQFIQSLSISD